jgi:erythromycin esterase-like protein
VGAQLTSRRRRATDAGRVGELNLGQLVRERAGRDTFAIGFTTYAGEVTAASSWGGPAERQRVRPALPGSWEALLHERGAARLVVDTATLPGERLQRAIGAVYEPETELLSHYAHARISRQFDALVHVDETQALEPLDMASEPAAAQAIPRT